MRLAVHDHDPHGPPAAVIAHGVGSSPRFVRDAFEAPLRAAGHRLVTYDLRGHGRSDPLPDPADHRLAEQAADLGAVAEAFDAHIVGGVSLGGHAAAAWAATRGPDLAGVLVCLPGWLGPVPPGDGPHAAIAAEVRSSGVAGVLERVVGDPDVPRWLRDLLERDWSRCDPASLGAALVSLDGVGGPTAEQLAGLVVPVGVCTWPDDPGHPSVVAEAWVEALPRAALAATSMEAVGDDPSVLGATALGALAGAGAPSAP